MTVEARVPGVSSVRRAGAAAGRRIGGHPAGLYVLTFTEAWERFSFYGMQALVVLYMVDQLLRPGHAEHVLGLGGLRAAVEAVMGPVSPQAFASEIFGLYGGLVYFTPILGGMVGDRWLGRRRTVTIGAVLMAAGHLLMSLEAGFLAALLLLIVGSGCLKGNITAQVGDLYPPDDALRTRAYAIFNVGVNAGGLFGPLVCGAVGETLGWSWGFAVAGVMMLLALAAYLAGGASLPAERRTGTRRETAPPLGPADWRTIRALLAMLGLGLFFSIPFYQLGNTYLVWVSQAVDRRVLGMTVPATWFLALNSLAVIASTPVLVALWRWQAKRGREPGDMAKIAIAAGITAAAYAVIALADRGPGEVGAGWALLLSAVLGPAFVYQWPTTLALISRAAPRSANSTLVGVAFLTLFVTYNAIGWLGGLYEKMSHSSFWLMHGAIAAVGVVLIWATKRPLTRALEGAGGQEAA